MTSLPPGKGPGKEQPSLRYPSNGKTIYQRPLNRTKTSELSQSSFAYLFSEMVSYAQKRVTGIQDLEKRCATSSPLTEARVPGSLSSRGYRLRVDVLEANIVYAA